jgi:23S rRNA U2552 (ribose-2'-O)-methylase RlmE/FtsJ
MEGEQLVPPWLDITWVVSSQDELPVYAPVWSDEGWTEKDHTVLNDLKQKIDAFERDGTWEIRKKIANPYELVYTHEEKKMPICLAKMHPLSRSYFKMIEILSVTRFFQRFPKVKTFRSSHVCEGPGGFIQAFVERCAEEKRPITISLAMSLKPTHSQIPGWKRAVPFLRKNPVVKIFYGADGTGDLYKKENRDAFSESLGAEKSYLFTADGGFDFKTDFLHQEKTVFNLIVASFATGFESLAVGGVMVVKLFDIFSRPQKQLIAYVSLRFREWTLYKPAMSRPCNSERYFIGLGFRGATDETRKFFDGLQADLLTHDLSRLSSLFEGELECMRDLDTFQEKHEAAQITVIQSALNADLSQIHEYWCKSYRASETWCTTFEIKHRKMFGTP